MARTLLGSGDRVCDPNVCRARRLRSGCRDPLRHPDQRAAPDDNDGRHCAILGWQRDLAGPGRGRALCHVPDSLCDLSAGVLPAGRIDAVGDHLPRRRLRVPRAKHNHAAGVGLRVHPRFADHRLCAGYGDRRDGAGIACGQWPLRRRRIRMADAVCDFLRNWRGSATRYTVRHGSC